MPTRLLIGSEVLDPDVTISEQYLSPAIVTSHPVEQGADIVDHVQEQPETIVLDLLITETPLTQPSFGTGGATLTAGSVYVLTGSLADRARQLRERLKATRTNGELLTLESAREGTIQNLAVQNISAAYNAARSARMSLTLVQIRIADTRTVAIPETLQPRQKKKRTKGKQPAKQPGATQSKSLLAKLADSI
jgi:hypothetical protein